MGDTAVPTIMDIVGDLGGDGAPATIVEALWMLKAEIDEMPSDALTGAEIDAITKGGNDA